MSEKIKGVVNKIIFEKNGFYIVSIEKNDDNTTFVAKINIPKLYEGVPMEFIGDWVEGKRDYGKQFKVSSAFEIKPETANGLVRYLSSKLFPGIGPVIAKRVVEHYGEENVIEGLENNIDDLIEISGISKRKLLELKVSWKKNRGMADAMVFLHSHEISTILATKIYETYGYDCISIIEENPYRLINDIYNIGFKKADEIALNIGIKEDSIERMQAAIEYILGESNNFGHCYLTFNQLTKQIDDFLNINSFDRIKDALHSLTMNERVVEIKVNEENVYYIKYIYDSEIYCSEKIKRLVSNKKNNLNNIEKVLNKKDIKIGEEQKEAIINILNSNISVLTGGPGTGKSFTINTILNILDDFKQDYVLAAPTGRAAQRIMELTNRPAKTIHRLLKWSPSTDSFEKNEDNPINTNFVIIDESSMVDINLAASLLKAIHRNCKVLFVGDVDQLPPVGPGSFFKDLIESKIVNVSILKKIYRQNENSKIVVYAHEINNKKIPKIPSPIETKNLWKDGADCMFIESGYISDANSPKYSTLKYKIGIQETVLRLYSKTIHEHFGKDAEIQILSPLRNKGKMSSLEINKMLQEKTNPFTNENNELKIGNLTLRINDRVMQMTNNYMLDVFNGDIGKIKMINKSNFSCIVEFSNGREVVYKNENLFELELARACTIHKSQGSEFDCVIIPLLKEHYAMLYNSLIYTALTRAKKLAIFIGDRQSLQTAINNIRPNLRQTRLKSLLSG